MKSKIFGVGINDSTTPIQKNRRVQGKVECVWRCPYYNRWVMMLQRCYSESYLKKKPSYRGCTVCDSWKLFSNFKSWMGAFEWQGKHLDKDILLQGNKIYCPDFCMFISDKVNTFVLDNASRRGEYLIGVTWNKHKDKFIARINNPVTLRSEYLGAYLSEELAHKAWRVRKLELVHLLEEEGLISDTVKSKLIERYSVNS